MPVTAGCRQEDISQREQYAKGGVGRIYWDFRDRAALKHVHGRRILDAGCGEGITLEKILAAHPDAEVLGVDLDRRNIDICRGQALPALQASLYDLPFSDASFDASLFLEVIEHLGEPDRAVAELARVTRPGGSLVVIYPLDYAMWLARVICLRLREARFDPGHQRQWTRPCLRRLLEECGFQVIASRGLPLFWPLALHGMVVGKKRG